MNKYMIYCMSGLMFVSANGYAGEHEAEIDVHAMEWASQSVQRAQTQMAKVGKTDTSTPAGKKAKQLIARGKMMQNRIRAAKGKPLSKQQANQLQALIKQMDQTARAGKGTQGACFRSCDNAYGSGFGGGKGWNRFWCKGSCFKINVNVGGVGNQKPQTGVGSASSKLKGAKKPKKGLLLPAVQK